LLLCWLLIALVPFVGMQLAVAAVDGFSGTASAAQQLPLPARPCGWMLLYAL
jgi:hypothetical protein